MTSASSDDRFRGLLDIIVASVEEHSVTGSELAIRGNLSRFHFDRLIKSMIGEAPGAFRRRLILERAAFELSRKGRQVGDVAFDAGYASPEAFSRAFQRSYGVTPSTARQRQLTELVQLPTPNGIHFHPPGGLRLPPDHRSTTMDVLTGMIEHDLWLVDQMLTRAESLDEGVLDAQLSDGSDETTLRELLTHLVWQKEMWSAAVEGVEAPDGGIAPIPELQHRLSEVTPRFIGLTTRALNEGRADETFIDATCDPPHTFTFGGMIAHVLTFSAYRRTVALEALKHAGVDDLGFGDPMGYLAEHA